MSEDIPRRGDKFKFCCYEIQQFEDDHPTNDNKLKNNKLMLDPTTTSKIKFNPTLTNSSQPIHSILSELFEGYKDLEQILPILERKRVNPEVSENLTDRDDLQYFIPQLITYMVIERNLANQDLNNLIIKACLTDFFFAHCVYFYLQSLATNSQGMPIQKVRDFIEDIFLPRMQIYSGSRLSGYQIIKSMLEYNHHVTDYQLESQDPQNKMNNLIKDYGSINYPNPAPENPPTVEKVKIKIYSKQNPGFMETPKFWGDLIEIGQKISMETPQNRNNLLAELIKKNVNVNLPSTVYIPFFSYKIRYYTVLNIWEGRIFSTKERAPFSIWLQIYREEEEQQQNVIEELEQEELAHHKGKKEKAEPILKKIYNKISRPFSIIDGENTLKIKKKALKHSNFEKYEKKRVRFISFHEKYDDDERPPSLSLVYDSRSDDMGDRKSSSQYEEMRPRSISQHQEYNHLNSCEIFPQSSDEIIADFKKKSIYRNLKSWRMMHLMVKIGDDLRQEQFAMQLISRFQYIFEKQKVPCILKPYEVMALGPDFGLIEMINDVITFDGLFKKLGADRQQKISLKQFFNEHFKSNLPEAKKNFLRSLAGYSLVTYFLQVKDRHNGNILLHKSGSIIHIDFGFFLSNAPGKGVELEKKVPFKLLTEYVQILGSLNSELFFQFRRLFYHGFRAILKNKNLVISLIKMMYKSHEGMMNCFLKGQKTIEELQIRMNPEGNLQNFCYELINQSLDNWRAKWYDKFQYFFQKIYY